MSTNETATTSAQKAQAEFAREYFLKVLEVTETKLNERNKIKAEQGSEYMNTEKEYFVTFIANKTAELPGADGERLQLDMLYRSVLTTIIRDMKEIYVNRDDLRAAEKTGKFGKLSYEATATEEQISAKKMLIKVLYRNVQVAQMFMMDFYFPTWKINWELFHDISTIPLEEIEKDAPQITRLDATKTEEEVMESQVRLTKIHVAVDRALADIEAADRIFKGSPNRGPLYIQTAQVILGIGKLIAAENVEVTLGQKSKIEKYEGDFTRGVKLMVLNNMSNVEALKNIREVIASSVCFYGETISELVDAINNTITTVTASSTEEKDIEEDTVE